jgi:hypothetical protein
MKTSNDGKFVYSDKIIPPGSYRLDADVFNPCPRSPQESGLAL